MARRRLWTAPQVPIGELVAEELREKGLPVTTVPTNMGEMYPSPFLEVWLEDDELLANQEVQRTIEDVIGTHELTEADAEAIEELPFQDVPEKPLVRIPKDKTTIVTAVVILVMAVLIYVLWTINR